MEADLFDTDYTDGKSYYIDISAIPLGTSYTFHFAANDTLGDWSETSEIDAPDVVQRTGILTAFDETVDYSDNAFLNASLMEGGTPIAGEDVAFYVDVNNNGIYEAGELVGSGATLADGSVSLVFTSTLALGTYDFIARYLGSGDYDDDDDEAFLFINAKQATLIAVSDFTEEGETTSLNATLFDDDGAPILGEKVGFWRRPLEPFME